MKNKKSLFIACGAALVVAALLAFFLLSKGGRSYTSALPSDVQAVACLDAKALLKAADLSLSDMGQLISRFSESEESEPSGIDMTSPVYAFVDANGNTGFLSAVSSEDELQQTLAKMQDEGRAGDVTLQRGLSWCVIDGKWLLSFDDKKALIMGPATGDAQDQLRNTIAELMQQSRSDSGAKAELTELTEKADAPLSATLSAKLLPQKLQQTLQEWLKTETLDDVFVRLQLATKDNVITLSADLPNASKAVSERLDDIDDMLDPIDGNLIEYSHDNSLAWICMNIDGKEVLEQLRSIPELRTMLVGLNLVVDVDAILRSIDGDLALDIPDQAMLMSLFGGVPPMMLTARLDDDDFLKQSSYWLESAAKNPGFRLKALSETDFSLKSGNNDINFGVHDKVLYVNTQSRLGTNADGHAAWDYLSKRKAAISGQRFYAVVNVQPLSSLATAATSDKRVESLVGNIHYIEFTMPTTGRIELNIIGAEGTNIARNLLLNE